VARDVVMPALGMAQETGRIIRWLAAEGSEVRKGEALLEIETDKVSVEVEAPADGVLASVTAHEGEDVPVGQVIARILVPGESGDAPPTGAEHDAPSPEPQVAQAPAAEATTKKPSPVQRQRAKRAAASPKARRLAAESGVELASVEGSGPGGAVVAGDLAGAVPPSRDDEAAASTASTTAASTAAAARIGVSPAWRVMAARTAASWTTAPHFSLSRDVSAQRLLTWLERIRARSGSDVTVTDVILRVVAASLREHPRLNGSWSEDGITAGGPVNLGLAVATDDELVVPVIAEAERLSVEELAGRRRDLVERARSGGLRPADVQGGTFTVTNLGMYGVDSFAAVINPPQAAILAVGRIAKRPVAEGERVVVRSMMTLTLTCDHRVVDGAGGARFLDTLAELLEEPLGLFA
jgi:pyruvate dehydrogenase E2 component (dihydrolipoamide acetyltransferase)